MLMSHIQRDYLKRAEPQSAMRAMRYGAELLLAGIKKHAGKSQSAMRAIRYGDSLREVI